MTFQEQVNNFQKTCTGLIQEMHDWFFGLDTKGEKTYTPEEALLHQMREQAQTLEQQVAFTKRAIQDGRQAQEFLKNEFIQTLMLSIRNKRAGLPEQTIKQAKTMEEVTYARGYLEGSDVLLERLETIVRIGKAAETQLVALTKRQGGA